MGVGRHPGDEYRRRARSLTNQHRGDLDDSRLDNYYNHHSVGDNAVDDGPSH